MNVRNDFSPAAFRRILGEAAGLVRDLYERGVAAAATRKADGSWLTEADLACNEFLRRELGRLLPTAGWLSEETADDAERLTHRWAWVVDPLDGTKEFTRGIPEFAISVGLVCHGVAVGGGVVNPVTDEGGLVLPGAPIEFWGWSGRAAGARALAAATASVSRSEVEDGTVTPLLGWVGQARSVGSVAYKLLRVAAGADDLTFSVQPKSEWDICGGVALLRAAGRVYRRCDGGPVRFNQRDTRLRAAAVAGSTELVEEFLTRHRGLARTESCRLAGVTIA